MKQKVELDTFDIVEGLYLHGGQEVQFLNGLSLHGSLLHSMEVSTVTTENTILALIAHWQQFGLPKYVQFDNDLVFQGSRMKDVIGKVIRLCLSLKVIPVFTTPYEQGFQGKIERFNGEIQEKFWQRRTFKNIKDVATHLRDYVQAHRLAHQEKILSAPRRRAFPKRWKRDDSQPLRGMIIYLRRTDGSGRIKLLGREFLVSKDWLHRLVRVEVDIDEDKIRFFALRRADWKRERLIKTRTLWQQHLDRSLPSDQHMYLAKCLALPFSRLKVEKCPILYGLPNTGKSTTLEIYAALIGRARNLPGIIDIAEQDLARNCSWYGMFASCRLF